MRNIFLITIFGVALIYSTSADDPVQNSAPIANQNLDNSNNFEPLPNADGNQNFQQSADAGQNPPSPGAEGEGEGEEGSGEIGSRHWGGGWGHGGYGHHGYGGYGHHGYGGYGHHHGHHHHHHGGYGGWGWGRK